MLSSERISNLFDKIISTLLMDICIYIYMLLFQFKTVWLFPLDFSIQNVLSTNNILNSYIKYWNQILKSNWKTKQIVIVSRCKFTSIFNAKKMQKKFISRRKKCETIVYTSTWVRQFDIVFRCEMRSKFATNWNWNKILFRIFFFDLGLHWKTNVFRFMILVSNRF